MKGKGGRPAKIKNTGVGRPKHVVDIRDIMKLDGHSPIPASLKKAASHILALTAKKSPNQLLEIKTGGPNPLIFAPVTVGRKDLSCFKKNITSPYTTNHKNNKFSSRW